MATQTPITLCKILSQTWWLIAAHPSHFSALSSLFLLPISISAVLYYPFLVSQPQLLPLLIYTLSTLPFSLCAGSSITYATFAAASHDNNKKPAFEIIHSLKSILVSFFPLLATRFLAVVIIWLIAFAFAVLPMLAGLVAYMFGLDMDHAQYFIVFAVVIAAIMMMGLIYLQIEWCVSTPVVVLESKWGYAPLKRSSYLVEGTRMVALRLFLFFGCIGGVLSMWYYNLVVSRGKGSFCVVRVDMVVYVVFTTVLSLFAMVANTVLFINCKASRGEMAIGVIDEETGVEFVALLKA